VGWRRGHTFAQGLAPETGFDPSAWTSYSEAMLPYVLGLGGVQPPLEQNHSWQFWTMAISGRPTCGYSLCGRSSALRASVCAMLDRSASPRRWLHERPGPHLFENSGGDPGPAAYSIENHGLTATARGSGLHLVGRSGHQRPQLARRAPALNEDGTVAPRRFAGALPFAAEYALPTLADSTRIRGPLWTGTVLRTAFNLQTNWWDTEVVGVDQGALLL